MPIVVLVVALAFRSYLAEIIGRATGVEWGSFKVAFERKLETAEEKANLVPESDAAPQEQLEQPLPPDNLPPEYLVLEAWRQIEVELVQLAERAGQSLARGRSALYLARMLRSSAILDPGTAALLEDLRKLRNAVAHPDGGPPITREQALRFRALTDLVLARLRGLPSSGG